MIKASIATVLFSLALLAYSFAGAAGVPWFVPVSGFAIAGVTWLSTRISAFLRIFIGLYVLAFWFLALVVVVQGAGLVPESFQSFVPPAFMTMAVTAFALLVYGVSFLPLIRKITALTDPYFESREASSRANGPWAWLGSTEGRVGAILLGISIAINFIQVGLTIRFNIWYRDLFNALQEYKEQDFWFQLLGVFSPLAIVWICIAIFEVFVNQALRIRWRAAMTTAFTGRWMNDGTHFRIPLLGVGTDNPDQRIQADIGNFISQVFSLSVSLLSQAATLVSFMVVLWGLSRDFPIPFTDTVVPGFLVWLVIVYAIMGTWLTHLVGRPLIALNFRQEKVEADFRFSLARLREYNEQVALMHGEGTERRGLRDRFQFVIDNSLAILTRQMKLTTFTGLYDQISVVFPYIMAAPSYFAKKITLGQFQQTASAFARVQGALSYFIAAYSTLASFQAQVDRLTTFSQSIDEAAAAKRGSAIAMPSGAGEDVAVQNLDLKLPTGVSIVAVPSLTLRRGESVLLTGPSGSGKSTLFRAIAGIWPFGSGAITVPGARSVLLLPQAPYLPQGVLRDAVSYPSSPGHYPDEALRAALDTVGLGALAGRLDEAGLWAQTLSGGEKQRLALARALLAKPDWLFLDEATSALDEPSEAAAYAAVARALPDTTIVSIGHRSTLVPLHDRQITMRAGDDGLFRLEDVGAPALA